MHFERPAAACEPRASIVALASSPFRSRIANIYYCEFGRKFMAKCPSVRTIQFATLGSSGRTFRLRQCRASVGIETGAVVEERAREGRWKLERGRKKLAAMMHRGAHTFGDSHMTAHKWGKRAATFLHPGNGH